MTGTLPFNADTAAGLAVAAHRGQTEKDGAPYWHHLARVAAAVPPAYRALAWLHDLFEDTPWTCAELLDLGPLPVGLCSDLAILTKPRGALYPDFIVGIVESGSVPALVVKRVDVADHLRPGHEAVLTAEKIAVYRDALAVLDLALEERRVEVAADLLARIAVLAGRWNTATVDESGVARAARAVIGDLVYRDELFSDVSRAGLAGAAAYEAMAVLHSADRERTGA